VLNELRFDVLGKPRPKGSLKVVGPAGRGGVKEANKYTAPWRESVMWAATRAIGVYGRTTGDRFVRIDGPVEVEVVFSFDKPASAPKTRETWPVTRSTYDVDKLQRCLFDALTDAGVFTDDSRVIRVVAAKAYCGEPPSEMELPGARVIVRPYQR
jgi:hypothetical protein